MRGLGSSRRAARAAMLLRARPLSSVFGEASGVLAQPPEPVAEIGVLPPAGQCRNADLRHPRAFRIGGGCGEVGERSNLPVRESSGGNDCSFLLTGRVSTRDSGAWSEQSGCSILLTRCSFRICFCFFPLISAHSFHRCAAGRPHGVPLQGREGGIVVAIGACHRCDR